MLKYISTKTAIRRNGIQAQCPAPVQVDSSLAEILKFDVLDELLATEDRVNQTETSLFEDVTGNDNAASTIKVNITTPSTFMLRIDDDVLAKSGMTTYGIDVVSIFTMYFISNVKRDSMFNLLGTRKGFTQYGDGSINPDDDLLRICPLNRIKGVYGCIARFEVQTSLYDFEDISVLAVASDAQMCTLASESWAAQQRTASVLFVQALRTHTSRVRDNYHINAKSSKAFVVSQDVPWSDSEFANDPSLSYLQYLQVYFNPTYVHIWISYPTFFRRDHRNQPKFELNPNGGDTTSFRSYRHS